MNIAKIVYYEILDPYTTCSINGAVMSDQNILARGGNDLTYFIYSCCNQKMS